MSGRVPTRCLLCPSPNDEEVYPELLRPSDISPYGFSARRARQTAHYRIVRCRSCGLVRSDPILPPGEIDGLYQASDFLYSAESSYAGRTYAGLARRYLQGRGRAEGALLEIGCGNGSFLQEMGRLGWGRMAGVEPSEKSVAAADPAVAPLIVRRPFSRGIFESGSFDAVCMFHVLDHLPEPGETVDAVREVTRPGGRILVVCHDVDAWPRRLFGEHSPVIDIEHVYLFGERTLQRFFEARNYATVALGSLTNTYPLGYWMRMTPGAGRLEHWMPGWLSRFPVPLRAGNLYYVGEKKDG